MRSCVRMLVELLSPESSREQVAQATRNADTSVTDLAANNINPLRRPTRPAPASVRKKLRARR
jgi:hypothetical protein